MIKVLDKYFVYDFVLPSKKLWDINPNQAQFVYETASGQKIYFKRKTFPNIQNIQEKDTETFIKSYTQKLINQFTISQENISKYILSYSSLIISYPYACFIHKPTKSLWDIITQRLDFPTKIQLMLVIAYGIQDLHKKQIVIGTLTPSTIVILNHKENFQIAFEDAQLTKSKLNQSNGKDDAVEQSIQYLAPEIQEDSKKISSASDIWSLGLIYYQILFEKRISTSLIQRGDHQLLLKNRLSWLSSFLLKLLNPNPKGRHKISDVIRLLKNAELCSNELPKYF